MARIHHLQFCVVLVIFLGLLASSSATSFLSDGIFGDHIATGRNLLQAKKSCPVNFEFQNYTIITSQCKAPQYPAVPCCAALKEFACPFLDDLNDLQSDCAKTMFSYINIHGNYPTGLFSTCRDDKVGLVCPAPPPSQSADANGSLLTCNPSTLLILATTFMVLLLQFF